MPDDPLSPPHDDDPLSPLEPESDALPTLETDGDALPTPPDALPDELFTIRYDYGTPFSTGPIGQEAAWIFALEAHAQEAIAEALEAEPDAGVLTVDATTLDEIRERFAFAVFVDVHGNPWPLLAGGDGATEDEKPLPDEPYALFVKGGGIDRYRDEAHEGDWVVHRDDDEERDYVLFFEDMDTAQQVRDEFERAAGDMAEVRRTRADTLTPEQGVRYYHATGQVEDMVRTEYLRRCR